MTATLDALAYRLTRRFRLRRRLAQRGPLYRQYPEERQYGPYPGPGQRAGQPAAHAAMPVMRVKVAKVAQSEAA